MNDLPASPNTLSRRSVLAMGFSAAIATRSSAIKADAVSRPNILWMVSEDNNPYLGCYGDPIAHTPTLDALAKKGVLYRNAFSNGPVCATSRFGILTGVYAESCAPANHMRATAHLPKELKTYPEYLREAGYYCINNFKTDYNCDVDPKAIWDDSSSRAQWRNRPPGKPFMAVFNDLTTHESQIFFKTEGRVKPEDVRVPAYLPDTPEVRTDLASYYNRIEMMDANCGKRLAALEADGLAEDTIVFYYSDNGGVMPRSKHYSYDEGYRTCLIIYVPPKWQHLAPAPAGSEVDTAVSYIDLVPTLLSLIGKPKTEHMPGRALLGPYAGKAETLAFGSRDRQDERYDFSRSVCDGRYRYSRNYRPDIPWSLPMGFAWEAKSYQSWEQEHVAGRLNAQQNAFFGTKPYEEFYDLKEDRDEVRNLIDNPSQARRIASLRRALDQHMLEINDNGFIPEGSPAEGYFGSRNRTVYPLERLMVLGEKAAQRNPRNFGLFRKHLADENDLVRYWAAYGLQLLGHGGTSAVSQLSLMAEHDPSPYVQIIAAQAIVGLGEPDKGVAQLAAILDKDGPFPIRLQAMTALTLVGEPARAALRSIQRAAHVDQEYLRSSGRYLLAVLDGTYKPGYETLDREWFDKHVGAFIGHPMPGPTY
jgi:arylsulfatase A-like enzyme